MMDSKVEHLIIKMTHCLKVLGKSVMSLTNTFFNIYFFIRCPRESHILKTDFK